MAEVKERAATTYGRHSKAHGSCSHSSSFSVHYEVRGEQKMYILQMVRHAMSHGLILRSR